MTTTPATVDSPDFIELEMEPLWLVKARRLVSTAETTAELQALLPQLRQVIAGCSADDKAQVQALINRRSDAFRASATTASETASASEAPEVAAEAPVVTSAQSRPMVATWTRIPTGQRAGQWGIRVEHLQYGIAICLPAPGDQALVNRSGGGAQVMHITEVVTISTSRGYSICTVTDPVPGSRATAAVPRGTGDALFSVAPTANSTPTVNSAPDALVRDLAQITDEAAVNSASLTLGSTAEGTRRAVGFSTPEQYLQALRNGGLQPHTRAEYLRTVRAAGLAFDESTLPPANDTSNALPVGPGIVHMPTGPSVFDLPKAQRAFKIGDAAKAVKTGTTLLRSGDLIAGAIAGGAGGDFSWAGAGKVTRAALLAALTEIGREGDAPAAKDAHAQAGRAVTTLRASGYHVHAIQGSERRGLPAHVAHLVGARVVTTTMLYTTR